MPRAICWFYNSARGCRNGNACNFRHVQELSSEDDGLAAAAPCRNFARVGYCSFGERCWYSHEPQMQPEVEQKREIAGQAPVAAQEAALPKATDPPSPER